MFKKRTLIFLTIFAISHADDTTGFPFQSVISLKETFGEEIGVDDSYTTIGLNLASNEWSSYIPIADVRWHYLHCGDDALNSAVGFRFTPPDSCHQGGLFAFYDYRRVNNQFFDQVGGQIEYIGPYVELRLHGYWPFRNERLLESTLYDEYVGDFFAISDEIAYTFRQLFFDVGKTFHFNRCLETYFSVGGYYIDSDPWSRVGGGRGTLEVTLLSQLKGFVRASYDSHFRGRFSFGLELRFPLTWCGWCVSSNFDPCAPAYRPIRSQEIIPIEKECCWEWNY